MKDNDKRKITLFRREINMTSIFCLRFRLRILSRAKTWLFRRRLRGP